MKIHAMQINFNNKSDQKYVSDTFHYKLSLPHYDKISFGHLKKDQLNSIFDYAYMKLHKISLGDFKSLEEFNKMVEFKTSQIMDLKNYKGKNEETTNEARNILANWKTYLKGDDWKNYLESQDWKDEQTNDYYNKATPALSNIIFSSIAKDINPNKGNIPLELDINILKKTAKSLKDNLNNKKPAKFNFSNIYRKNMRLKYEKGTKIIDTGSKIGHWVCIPSKTKDPENFENNVKRLQLNSCNTWCVRLNQKAIKHLEIADCYIFMSSGKPKVFIKIVKDELLEIQGEKNNWKIPANYAEDIKLLINKINITNSIYKPKSLKGWIRAIQYRSLCKTK
jgi:hypothetical protein